MRQSLQSKNKLILKCSTKNKEIMCTCAAFIEPSAAFDTILDKKPVSNILHPFPRLFFYFQNLNFTLSGRVSRSVEGISQPAGKCFPKFICNQCLNSDSKGFLSAVLL